MFELTPTFKRDNNPLPPPSDESKREAVKEFAKKVRVVIQTCNDPEYYAALEKLESPRIENQAFAKPVKYPHQVLNCCWHYLLINNRMHFDKNGARIESARNELSLSLSSTSSQ